jgi:CubicO group peptidase (beta-lactamase class C family)
MARRFWPQIGIAAGLLAVAPSPVSADDQQIVQFFADTFAQAAISEGKAVGVGVGVVYKNEVFYTNAFGLADAGKGTPFVTGTLFEIASNTKVFTTNLLGQAVFNGQLKLSDRLSQFSTALGTLKPLTGKVTLEELANFTGGFPSYAPRCTKSKKKVPGCLPSSRPTTSQYDAEAFLDYFQYAVPENYYTTPATPISSLPAPYNYSDFAIGLLGLLLANPNGGRINDASLLGWFIQVYKQILTPLGMNDTYLQGAQPGYLTPASGYSLALASATLKNGQIHTINVLDHGGHYTSAPAVTIEGGGGSGATAMAVLNSKGGSVERIKVITGGGSYIAPPVVSFQGGGPSEPASAVAIIQSGKVIAFHVSSGGAGYNSSPPIVTVSGGRIGGQDSGAAARIANGHVVAVNVEDGGGSGYVAPLAVTVAPGGAQSNVAPIWAPAGALLSTADDMTRFAAAASGVGPVKSMTVPAAMAAGFKTAETAYSCQAQNPALADCPQGVGQSALAWSNQPADNTNGFPEVVTKNGALSGFSSEIVVVPSRQLAVVVLINSDTANPAATIALDIAHNLVLSLP